MSFRQRLFLFNEINPVWDFLCKYQEVQYDDHAEDDAVPAEDLEVLSLNIAHKELYDEHRHHKRNNAAHRKGNKLRAREINAKAQYFEQRHAHHDGYGEEKGKLRRSDAGYTDDKPAYYGRAAAGRAGDDGQRLKQADNKSVLIGYLLERLNPRRAVFTAVFNDDKGNTVYDKGRGDHIAVIHEVEQQVCDKARDAGDDDLDPHYDSILFYHRALAFALKRPHFVPEQDYYREYRAELDDIQEQLLELRSYVHMYKLIHQQHMACA